MCKVQIPRAHSTHTYSVFICISRIDPGLMQIWQLLLYSYMCTYVGEGVETSYVHVLPTDHYRDKYVYVHVICVFI